MKAIIFDFDGTLTYKSRNVWKAMWQDLGYDISKESYFAQIYMAFIRKEISHQKWCDLTCDKFKERNMDVSILKNIAKEMRLINGFDETIKKLYNNGYSLHIVSGCIADVIKSVIGKENLKYFDSIKANEMNFDENGYLENIVGTKYDFEGKALFIEDFKAKTGCKAEDIIFVGNSSNDEWAHKSGCRTICINPENTCSTNKVVWNNLVENATDLKSILPYLVKDNRLEEINEK
jgi:HAD superfamily phosphoserine phosphatase-like hydrolase